MSGVIARPPAPVALGGTEGPWRLRSKPAPMGTLCPSLRIAILNTDYPAFLQTLYDENPALKRRPCDEQYAARARTLFGFADFHPAILRRLGHEAEEIIINAEPMQKQWAARHGAKHSRGALRLRLRGGWLPWIDRRPDSRWMFEILEARIRAARPDVVFNMAIDGTPAEALRAIRPHTRLMVGLAEPTVFLRPQPWEEYDLVLAASEGVLDRLRGMGVPSELWRFAFEPAVLDRMPELSTIERDIPVSFVGSAMPEHGRRRELLAHVCRELGDRMHIWSPSVRHLPDDPAVRSCYRGPAWGRAYYEVLARSRITLNCHIDIAGDSADNIRLYEATGMGAMLVTDEKRNLPRLFEPGREVVAWRTPAECVALVRRYLGAEPERAAIARAGQGRTLREHTWEARMREFVGHAARYLG